MIHVIVADSHCLRIYEETARGAPEEVAVFRNPANARHERDWVSDRPGRVINSASGAHQAYQPRTPASRHGQKIWLRAIAGSVRQLLDERANQALVLIASRRMLPALKHCLPAAVLSRMCKEVPVDIAQQPSSMQTKRLLAVLHSAEVNRMRPGRIHELWAARPSGRDIST